MSKIRRGYMTIDVDLDEAIEQIDDQTLLQEVESRKLNMGCNGPDPEEDLRDAYAAILRGHRAEAISILDRLIRPKWNSVNSCEADFKRFALTSQNGKTP
jgi:hypothetical protein